MRTLGFIIGGFVLLGICLGVARAMGSGVADATRSAALVFVALWFVVAAGNMAVGVLKAGYSAGEEFPIFLLIFVLPAAVALFLRWKVL
jgi:hypothetical protein